MPRRRIPTLALALALAACASPSSAPQTCASDADCPAGARCAGASCVANAPPVPAIGVPSALEAWALLAFDGSASADPDAGDSVVGWAWTFRPLDAACPPPVVAGALPVAQVRFGCAGRYAVELTVTDAMARSATATEEVEVAAPAGPSAVIASDDLTIDHACTSLPARCTPAGEIALAASAPELGEVELAFSWTVEPPPGRPLDAKRRVTFSPSASVPAPTVSLETDGEAISGDWIFRVEARDAAGVVGAAVTRVSVLNRPPTVVKTIPVVNHAFAGGQFTAAGEIPFTVSDPDGDVVQPTIDLRHAGDGDAATFFAAFVEDPPRVAFAITVPGDAPENLIRPSGLERTIVFTATDANGEQVTEEWAIVVANRPPALSGGTPAPFTLDHLYDPVAAAYLATVPLSRWSDPDGDPLFQDPGQPVDPQCADIRVENGRANAYCRLAFDGTPAVAAFAGQRTITQVIQDPWATAAQASAVTFTIANRPPQVTDPATPLLRGYCALCAASCGSPAEPLDAYCFKVASVTVSAGVYDPDGDPLAISATPNGGLSIPQPLVCPTHQSCLLPLALSALPASCAKTKTVGPLWYSVSDGLAAAGPAAVYVDRSCY